MPDRFSRSGIDSRDSHYTVEADDNTPRRNLPPRAENYFRHDQNVAVLRPRHRPPHASSVREQSRRKRALLFSPSMGMLIYMPMSCDAATCMYSTGIDPFSKQEVHVARNLRDRKLQRSLLQFFKPDNYFGVRKALEQAGRTDLIGGGCDALIRAHPPKDALQARREQANKATKRCATAT